MFTVKGKGVYGSVAIGNISVLKKDEPFVKRERTDDVEMEKQRYILAKEKSVEQIEKIYKKALKEVGEANAQIFEVHMMMLEDEDYNESILSIIEKQSVSAEYAVATTGDNFSSMFKAMDDPYMQERASDVKDISSRIINNLSGENEKEKVEFDRVIICAKDLAPSETVSLDKDKVIAFVTAYGSSNSHTAILARTMNIPAIIGVGEEFLSKIQEGDIAAVDGEEGIMYVSPDDKTIKLMQQKQRDDIEHRRLLQNLKGKDNITLDGKKINIFANIGSEANIGEALINDAGGIGLFRSEFLYLGRKSFPDEEMQFRSYKKVLESMSGKKVIIRTLDIGADKQAEYFGLDKEENPAMGFRALRICLSRPDIFKVQLRALYRASVYGNLGIMFPMVTGTGEVKRVFEIIDDVKKELIEQGISYSDDIELGIMIETPAAAIISDKLAPLVDFFSIGTNDLTQYTLAIDRQNPKLDDFCDTHHEAVMRLIEFTVQNAHKNNKWVGICGELASDVTLTEKFIKMGVDELSVSPGFVLKVREAVRNIRLN